MDKTTFAFFGAAMCACAVVAADGESPRARDFANPPAHMRLIDRRLDNVKAQTLLDCGYGGMSCSVKRNKNYLRDEAAWAEFVRLAREAHEAGLVLWLYDEYGYPSGTAGFEVLDGHPELQVRGMLTAYADVKAGETVEVEFPPGNKLGAAALPVEDGRVDVSRQRNFPPCEGKAFSWRAPDGEGTWRVCACSEDALYEGTFFQITLTLKAPYINLLDKRATRRFIELTHERYAAHFGKDEFPRLFRSTFTDEPTLAQWVRRKMPYLNLPWCHDLGDEYRKATGRDLVKDIPRLAFETKGAEGPAARYAYRHIVGERVKKNHFGQIADWCRRHGIWSGGHLYAEEAVAAHTGLFGDFFGCLRSLTAPGVDCLNPYPEKIDPLLPLYASSAADLNGEGAPVMCEFSSHGAKKDALPTREETIGYALMLVAGGITEFVSYHRLFAFGTDAEKRDFNAIVGRAVALTKGTRSAADVAMLYPCESLQVSFLPSFVGCGGVENFAIDRDYKATSRALYGSSRSFMVVDSDSIAKAKIVGKTLVFGHNVWRAIVLPRSATLPLEAVRKLAAFKAAGGCVAAVGRRPENSTTEFPSAEVSRFGASLRLLKPGELAAYLEKCVPPHIRFPAGANPIRVLRRKAYDGDVFFLYNSAKDGWEGEIEIDDGRDSVEVWRPVEGDHFKKSLTGGRMAISIPGLSAVGLTSPEGGQNK